MPPSCCQLSLCTSHCTSQCTSLVSLVKLQSSPMTRTQMVLDTLVYSPLNYLKRLVAREYIIEVHTCTLVGGLVNFYEWVWFPFFVYSQLQQKLLQLKACFLRQTSKNKLRTTHLCRCLLCTNCEQSTDVPQSQTIPVRAFPIADRKPAPS